MYDVVIAGAGPAGAAAAALLAGKQRSVVLLERGSFPRTGVHTAWVNALAVPLLEEIGLDCGALLGEPFTEVVFYDAELGKSARPKLKKPPAHLVERETFDHKLVGAAREAGAELREGWDAFEVHLQEECVVLAAPDGQSLRGRMLLAATGPDSPLVERILPAARLRAGGHWTARVETQRRTRSKGTDSFAIVLGLNRQGAFGLVTTRAGRAAVAVSTPGDGQEVGELLTGLCRRLADKKMIPVGLSARAASAKVSHTPAGTALDLDSHVAKHTLVIGDAGGFVAAASDEGVYPAMWSARIAAEAVHIALSSRHSQDVLMEFDSKWRMAMAEYLRPPNTDTQFLIPLIFSNQPMADRMAAAFFAGENI